MSIDIYIDLAGGSVSHGLLSHDPYSLFSSSIITPHLASSVEESSFSFFADQTDIQLQNFFGKTELFTIEDGDLRVDVHRSLHVHLELGLGKVSVKMIIYSRTVH